MSTSLASRIDAVAAADVHARLGLREPFVPPRAMLETPLHEWRMEEHDAPLLAYLYRALRPRRHLEFGTWQGFGACLCLENSGATVWSINLWEGEAADNGHWLYYTSQPAGTPVPSGAHTRVTPKGNTAVQTDGGVAIGRLVRERGLSHRFNQVYCDSTRWDATNYPRDFFDTAFIDGGHTEEVVRSDTRKAMPVVRPGGTILWHDYCPDPTVVERCASVRGVIVAIEAERDWLGAELVDLFWVRPSWVLVGVRR